MNLTRVLFSKKFTVAIVVGLIAVILVTLFLASRVYRVAFEEAKASQGIQQLEMARSAALGIQYFLQHLSADLKMLASFPHVQYFEQRILKTNIDYFYKHTNQNAVESLFVVNRQNNLVYAMGDVVWPEIRQVLSEPIQSYDTDNGQQRVWVSRVEKSVQENSGGGRYLMVSVPIVQHYRDARHPNPSNRFVGLVGYVVDFNWLMQEFIKPIQVGRTGFAWVMDRDGRLLYHPRHPEMILRSVFSQDPACRRCHASFDKQIALIHNESTYEEYKVGNEPAKIMAQAPMILANDRWIVAVSIDLAEVTGIMRKNFQTYFWLIGLALSSIVLGGALLLWFNVRRVRAETNAIHSEQRRVLQGQVHQASKLASIGELVDSVAHEINTPVGIISAQVDAMLLAAKDTPNSDVLRIIKDQTRRIAGYTRSLLHFSRRMKFQPKPENLVDITEECLKLLGYRLRADRIRVRKNWPQSLPEVKVDRNQMQQVLMNLLNNAVDAVNDEGEIRISFETMDGETDQAGVRMVVSDTGPGIPPQNLSRIFDPFFTTKPADKGTGLGLAISQAIVKRHGGSITAENHRDGGASFIVFIPLNSTGSN
ncbi:hypothetical protein GWO43_05565 [candidate division KSB1 bacterium]|nr:hypothetical protein [candidate division KSB1 bacterium]NIR70629.1 hypothetical protein [candidate division KSB1 bacterium]NIS27732.1 hypothetical protein [candidate division KSB1 bacterium]NIT70361.1 hypothetical protein [candidate division KSB1 bacterium]NIU28399.1 hypothetical protein [candidate division KSB1 bacterium]